jgi:hypothetical protein
MLQLNDMPYLACYIAVYNLEACSGGFKLKSDFLSILFLLSDVNHSEFDDSTSHVHTIIKTFDTDNLHIPGNYRFIA